MDRMSQPRTPTDRNELALFTPYKPQRGPDGTFLLTNKLVQGVAEYSQLWDGPVTLFVETSDEIDSNLDHVAVLEDQVPFGIEVVPCDANKLRSRLASASIVVDALSEAAVKRWHKSASEHLPIVFISECTLRTRQQIIRCRPVSLLRKTKQYWNEMRNEHRIKNVLRKAAGLQCNGTPTYDAYSRLCRRPILFFDSRVTNEMLATSERLEAKASHLLKGERLRLVFSGRLNSIKGADALPTVANKLRQMNVDFVMHICGGGNLEQSMKNEVKPAWPI